jgi:tetratricopeptide (TPR) repeat protein
MLVSKKCRLRIMSKKSNPGSVSHWLANPSTALCDEGPDLLWKRFGMRLVRLARKQLKSIQDRTYDPEDLAQSAFRELHHGIDAGNFSALANRKQLWKLLVTISLNKSRNVRRNSLRHKRRYSKLTSAAAHLHLGKILDDPKRSPEWVALIANREIELESLRQDQAYVGLVLRHGDAQAHFQQIERHIAFLKKQIEQGVTVEQNRLRLTWATRNLAVHLRSYGQLDKSKSMSLEALELRRQMTALYPSVTRYKVDLAGTAIDLAATMKDLGEIDQAIRYAQEGIEGYRSVLKELPEETSYRVDLASQLHFLGHLYWDNFQDNQANEVFQESYQLAEKILASNPNNPLIQALYPELLWHQSQAQCLRGDWQAARDSLRTYWNAQYGSGNSNIRPAKDPASILELWEYCCLRIGDATAIKEVERLRSQFPKGDNKEQSDDISPQVQIQRLVRSAEASILAADKALLDQQSQEAYRLEQESLKHMQGVLGVIRSQPKEWKQQPGRLLEIWDLTLRNPGFTTVCVPSELDRWPSEHRQDWESIWHEIRSLTTDQTD